MAAADACICCRALAWTWFTTCFQQHLDTLHLTFNTRYVKRRTKVNIEGFQLGSAGYHQLHHLSITWEETGTLLNEHISFPSLFPEDAPWMQASWSGDAVSAVSEGFTVAPYSKSSRAHSRLPAAQALQRGVLPWMVRMSTWNSHTHIRRHLTTTSASLVLLSLNSPELRPPAGGGRSWDGPECRLRGAACCYPWSRC